MNPQYEIKGESITPHIINNLINRYKDDIPEFKNRRLYKKLSIGREIFNNMSQEVKDILHNRNIDNENSYILLGYLYARNKNNIITKKNKLKKNNDILFCYQCAKYIEFHSYAMHTKSKMHLENVDKYFKNYYQNDEYRECLSAADDKDHCKICILNINNADSNRHKRSYGHKLCLKYHQNNDMDTA